MKKKISFKKPCVLKPKVKKPKAAGCLKCPHCNPRRNAGKRRKRNPITACEFKFLVGILSRMHQYCQRGEDRAEMLLATLSVLMRNENPPTRQEVELLLDMIL